MGNPLGHSEHVPDRKSEDIIGEVLEEHDGRLYFYGRSGRHPVTVMATTGKVRVGCVTLTKEAWEVLKRKVDGVKA